MAPENVDGGVAYVNENTPLLLMPPDDATLLPLPPSSSFLSVPGCPSKVPSPRNSSQGPTQTSQPNGKSVLHTDVPRIDTNPESSPSSGAPAGLKPCGPNDENVVIFRRSVGFRAGNPDCADSSSPGPGQTPAACGIFRQVIQERQAKARQFAVLNVSVYACHTVQILAGAALTALGPGAGEHTLWITLLGALNTIIAGVLALFKGQGLPEKLHKDEIEFRRLQDWIEETDALLVAGVVGRNRSEVGALVELAFKKYNAVLASEENNKPENYVRQQLEGG